MALSKKQIGCIGETFTMFRLALRGIYSQKQNDLFDYDLLTNTHLRLEVKTSTVRHEKKKKYKKYKREYWYFRNQVENRQCDFYVFVCLNETLIPENVFIVPSEIIIDKEGVSIPREFKQKSYNGFSLKDYEDNFEVLDNKTEEELFREKAMDDLKDF